MTESTSNQPVVAPVKMPKLKLSGNVAALNAFLFSFGLFFGAAALVEGIANFNGVKWYFSIPFIGSFLGSNIGGAGLLAVGLLALTASIVGIVLLNKITDAEAIKAAWAKVRMIFAVMASLFLVDMVALALFSLISIGNKSLNQGILWGSYFVSNLILAVFSAAVAFIAHQIVEGKTVILRILGFIGIGLSAVAIILAVVSTIVNYSSKKSTYSSYDDIYDEWSSLLGD